MTIGDGPPGQRRLLHPRKREDSSDTPLFDVERNRFAIYFAAYLKRALENYHHEDHRLADAHVDITGFEMHLFRLAEEPGDLIIRQIGENRHASADHARNNRIGRFRSRFRNRQAASLDQAGRGAISRSSPSATA